MINCLLIDDEPFALELLCKYINEFKDMRVIDTCRNIHEALPLLQSGNVDLLFLDVKMPKVSGMQFLEQAKHLPEVVLTTAYREHAVQAYEYGVLDYLLKPISFLRFAKAVERYKEKHSVDVMSRRIIFKSGFEFHKIAPTDILYLQSVKEYVSIVCKSSKYLVRSTMSEILTNLPEGYFVQIHKTYIVPTSQIRSVSLRDVILHTGEKLPLGRSFAKRIKASFESGY